MAKIQTSPLIDGLSGKACQHSEYSFRTDKQTGNVYSYRLCNAYDGGNSVSQQNARTKFSNAVAAAKAVCSATSADASQSNYTKQVQYKALFKNQHKCSSFFGFVVKKEYALLNSAE